MGFEKTGESKKAASTIFFETGVDVIRPCEAESSTKSPKLIGHFKVHKDEAFSESRPEYRQAMFSPHLDTATYQGR